MTKEFLTKYRNVALIIIPLGLFFVLILLSSLTPQSTPSNSQTRLQPQVDEVVSGPLPVVKYDNVAQKKLSSAIDNPLPLSENDTAALNALTAKLNGNSGIVYESEQFRIEYKQTINGHMVKIKTSDIDVAKDEAITWYRNNGVSEEAICSLPIVFYVSEQVGKELKAKNIVFNSLAHECTNN